MQNFAPATNQPQPGAHKANCKRYPCARQTPSSEKYRIAAEASRSICNFNILVLSRYGLFTCFVRSFIRPMQWACGGKVRKLTSKIQLSGQTSGGIIYIHQQETLKACLAGEKRFYSSMFENHKKCERPSDRRGWKRGKQQQQPNKQPLKFDSWRNSRSQVRL